MRNSIKFNFSYPKKVFIVFLFIMVAIYVRLVFLAVSPKIDGIKMSDFAKARNTENRKLYATRGTIYDSENNILATNVSSYTVIAYLNPSRTRNEKNPMHVVDKERTAELLAPIINMEKERVLSLLNMNLYQVELGPGGRNITELKKDEILNLNLPGIDFIQTQKRNYPNGDFASYVIGYAKRYEEVISENNVNKLNYNIIGELGIEAKYNDLLRGIDGSITYQRDRFGYKIPGTKEFRNDALNGSDIHLTINANIQRFLEAEVKNANSIYQPEWIQITAMDAKTGAILGTSSTPSFNPNLLNIENYENPLISYLFEPGSTMKTFTYACAIEKGNYNGDELFDSGTIQIGPNTIKDWNNIGWGRITLDKGYEYSSNVGIYNVINKYLTKQDLLECFKKYGFGAKTEIELPREMSGKVNFNYEVEVINGGFGQGITTTAVQHLQAMTLFANNGSLVKPYIVEKIVDPNTKKVTYQNERKITEKVLSEKTVNKMKRLMHDVVNGTDAGTTGGSYKVEGFDIAGKTGTAQVYDAASGRYLHGYNDYIYSFSGMYPNDDPEIIIYAAMKKPVSGASKGLSTATKNIMKNIAKYLNIFDESEEVKQVSSYQVESYINKNLEQVIKKLETKGIEPIIIGNGEKVINQYPKQGENILISDKVFLLTNDLDIEMPSIIGWSKNDVINLTKLLKLDVEFDGYGYVKEQSIKKGEKITDELKLEIKLETKKKDEELT